MRKTSITHAILTVVGGIGLMGGCFFLFKHMPWRIDGDKMIMCALFETIIAFSTAFTAFSFFVENDKNKERKRRNP
jgi:hypothetical protein